VGDFHTLLVAYSAIHDYAKRKSPHRIWCGMVIDIVIVANITVFAVVITFAVINLAVIVLRYTESELKRPFKVPINVGRFPILPFEYFHSL